MAELHFVFYMMVLAFAGIGFYTVFSKLEDIMPKIALPACIATAIFMISVLTTFELF